MEPLVLFVLAGLGLLVFAIAVMAATDKASRMKSQVDASLRSITGFTPTDLYVSKWNHAGISIDIASRQVALSTPAATRVLEARQIFEVELLQDDSSLLKTNRVNQLGGVVVGGLLLGGVGAVIGGLSGSKRNQSLVRKLTLRILTDDFDAPHHDVVFFDWIGKGLSPDNKIYKEALEQAQLWHARVTQLLKLPVADAPEAR